MPSRPPSRLLAPLVALPLALLLAIPAPLAAVEVTVELLSQASPTLVDALGSGTLGGTSDDGRFVVFVSEGSNLSPDADTNGARDVFLYDRTTDAVTLVSHTAGDPGTPCAGESIEPRVSGDGNWVAFLSTCTDAVTGQVDDGFGHDVFLWERAASTARLVTRLPGQPTTANDEGAEEPSLSTDGSKVAFRSGSSELVAGTNDVNGSSDVFLFDRASGTVTLVSHAHDAPLTTVTGGLSFGVQVSGDGNWVVYYGNGTNLVAGQVDGNDGRDVFLYSVVADTHTLVSHSTAGPLAAGNSGSDAPRVSADGSWVAFLSVATNLVAATDANGGPDVFLFERATGAITLVSRAASGPGNTADGPSYSPVLSADGAHVAFQSLATDVTAATDTNDELDVFLYDRTADTLRLLSHAAGAPDTAANGLSYGPTLGTAGAQPRVAFFSDATNLVSGVTDANGGVDVFLYDLTSGSATLTSHRDGDPAAAGNRGWQGALAISSQGDWVAWDTIASDLSPTLDANALLDVYLGAAATGLTEAVSRRDAATPSASAGGWSDERPAVSADGRWVAFASGAPNLVPGQVDDNGGYDVFLLDRASGEMSLVSHAPAGATTAANGESRAPSVSADGAWVAFESTADDLVASDGNGTSDVFLYERATGAVVLVSHRHGAPDESAAAESGQPVVAAGGGWVAFVSEAWDLVEDQDDTSGNADVFLYEVATGANLLVSRMPGLPGTPCAEPSGEPSLSADGRWVAFTSRVPDLVVDQVDFNGADDVYLFDRTDGSMALVSHVAADPLEAAGGSWPQISADGSWIGFESTSDTVVTGQVDSNAGSDVFLYERATGLNRLVSRSAADPAQAADSESFRPALSADGAWVAFEGDASDYVAGQAPTGYSNVVLWSRADGTARLVSHNGLGDTTTGGDEDSYDAHISADGGRVLFSSDATDLVAGGTDALFTTDVFLYERSSMAVTLASRVPADPTAAGNDDSWPTAFASGGSGAAFASEASDLVAGDHNTLSDAFFAAFATPGAYQTLAPCRMLDTRFGTALNSGVTRVLEAASAGCGVPWNARAVSVNVTVTQPTGGGHLVIFPADQGVPTTSTINFGAAQTRANNAVIGVAPGTAGLAIRGTVIGGGTLHVIVDVTGWFE